MDKSIFNCKKFVTNNIYIKKVLSLKLTLEEFLVLTYFDNSYNSYLNIEELSKNLGLSLDNAYKVFNSLISKKLINIETAKDIEGRLIETVSLDNFYNIICEDVIEDKKEEKKTDIYSSFEKEFGRTITGMEYEIINAWLEKGYNEELILGALKEAVYNGVNNLRYIDKILYEWSKKGFKNMNDVDNHLKYRETKQEEKELFDYDWINSSDD